MNQRPSITIRFGASNDDISVDGQVFHRGDLNRSQQALVRNVVVGALVKSGALAADKPVKVSRPRNKRRHTRKDRT